MKKLYLSFPLLCLFAVSCTTSVVNEPETDAIAFRAPQAETRAVVDGAVLPGDFCVWGGYDNSATNVFNGTIVYSPQWDYRDGTRYWVTRKKYNFYAVYPASLSNVTVDTDGTIIVSGFDCTAGIDLMTATASRDYNGTDNSAVGLKFIHELARVTCSVKSETSAVTVNSLTFYQVGYKGTLIRTDNGSQWKDLSIYGIDNTQFKTDTSFALNATDGFIKDNVLGDLLLPPQTLSSAAFSLTYRYNGDTTDRIATVSIPADTQWTAGQHYNYSITFKASEIILNVSVLTWEEENTSVSWG